MTLRSVVAMPFTLLFFRLENQAASFLDRGAATGSTCLRGALLFLSYTTFMMGLAALPWPTWKRSASPARS
ncbi:MAG: hypothetical protein R2851_03920 [Caldilineaceae bacterium]